MAQCGYKSKRRDNFIIHLRKTHKQLSVNGSNFMEFCKREILDPLIQNFVNFKGKIIISIIFRGELPKNSLGVHAFVYIYSQLFLIILKVPYIYVFTRSGGEGRYGYACPTCRKVYKRTSCLKRHIHHECTNAPKFSCLICGHKSKRSDTFLLHLRKIHKQHVVNKWNFMEFYIQFIYLCWNFIENTRGISKVLR